MAEAGIGEPASEQRPTPRPRGPWSARSFPVTRRAVLRALAAGVPALLAGCRTGRVAPPPPQQYPPEPPTPAASVQPTATVTATAASSPAASPADVAQILHDGSFTQDPVSHDFNANPNCGGEPELWAGLLTFTPDLEPTPDWAETWEVSGDGTTWTFHLRRDNRGWSNGDPVTGSDFVWSWQRKLLPATGAADASVLFPLLNGSAVHAGGPPDDLAATALDDWTLVVRLEAPTPAFLNTVASLATVPAHQPSVEQYGPAWTEAGHCVSNGPFRLLSWQRGTGMTLAPNPGYWNADSVALTRVDASITPPDRTLFQYRLDRLDLIAVQGTDLPGLQSDAVLGGQLQQTVGNGTWALYPQPSVPPFDDLRVRRAVSRAVDRRRLVQIVSGRAVPATGLLPPGFPAHVGNADVAALQAFDVDAALQALEGTAFAGGRAWPPVTLLMRREDPDSELLGQDVASQLGENLGMKVDVGVLDPAAFDAAVRGRRPGLIWLRSWFNSPDPAAAYDGAFASADPARATTWANAAVSALLANARTETDPVKRLAAYVQCERALQQDVAYVPLVHPSTWYLVKPWVGGVAADRAGYPRLADQIYTRYKVQLRITGGPSG